MHYDAQAQMIKQQQLTNPQTQPDITDEEMNPSPPPQTEDQQDTDMSLTNAENEHGLSKDKSVTDGIEMVE